MAFRIVSILLLCCAVHLGHAQGRFFGSIQFIHGLSQVGPVDVYMNSQSFAANVPYQTATEFEGVLLGNYRVRMFPAGADTAGVPALAQGDVRIDAGSRGILIAIGRADAPQLLMRMGVRAEASSQQVELFLIHGAPDTGPIDLRLRDPAQDNRITSLLFNNFIFARASVYMQIDTRGFNYEVIQSATDSLVGSFYLNLSGFADGSGVLVAMGRGTTPSQGFTLMGFDSEGVRFDPYVTTGIRTRSLRAPAPRTVFPNPFSDETHISYNVRKPGPALLRIVDVTGRTVSVLHEGWHASGAHRVTWDGRTDFGTPAPSGVYLLHFASPNFTFTARLVRTR